MTPVPDVPQRVDLGLVDQKFFDEGTQLERRIILGVDLLEEQGGRSGDERGGDGGATQAGAIEFARVGGAEDVFAGGPDVDAGSVVGVGGLVVLALAAGGVVAEGADGDGAGMVGAVEACVSIIVSRSNGHGIPRIRQQTNRMIQRIAMPIHAQTQVHNPTILFRGIGGIPRDPILQHLLQRAQKRLGAALAVPVQDLHGMNQRRLGRSRLESHGDGRHVRSVVGVLIVRGAARADDALGEAIDAAVVILPLVAVGVDARVEGVNVPVDTLVEPDVLAVASAHAGDAFESPVGGGVVPQVEFGDGEPAAMMRFFFGGDAEARASRFEDVIGLDGEDARIAPQLPPIGRFGNQDESAGVVVRDGAEGIVLGDQIGRGVRQRGTARRGGGFVIGDHLLAIDFDVVDGEVVVSRSALVEEDASVAHALGDVGDVGGGAAEDVHGGIRVGFSGDGLDGGPAVRARSAVGTTVHPFGGYLQGVRRRVGLVPLDVNLLHGLRSPHIDLKPLHRFRTGQRRAPIIQQIRIDGVLGNEIDAPLGRRLRRIQRQQRVDVALADLGHGTAHPRLQDVFSVHLVHGFGRVAVLRQDAVRTIIFIGCFQGQIFFLEPQRSADLSFFVFEEIVFVVLLAVVVVDDDAVDC
mmetsp:Transcript_40879/g.85891  ORF Transcript_40879/g.85891 Transcript_40879/m.85891 type:complete len:637 (-) Transcript_40879:10-1920(-)